MFARRVRGPSAGAENLARTGDFGCVSSKLTRSAKSACTGGSPRIRGADINTNTVVLVVVAILVALALAGIVAAVGYKLRTDRRLLGSAGILDEMAEDARLVEQQDHLADDLATKAQAAQLDSGIEAFRTRGRRRESADSRDAADMRAQLKDHGSPTD